MDFVYNTLMLIKTKLLAIELC